MPIDDPHHSRPLDVHRWSDHPEVNDLVGEVWEELFGEEEGVRPGPKLLTKTDFIHYLNCPKSLWLAKREPENFPPGHFTAFQRKLVREGEEIEESFRQHLGLAVDYEVEFRPEHLYARADGVDDIDGGRSILREGGKRSFAAKRNDRPFPPPKKRIEDVRRGATVPILFRVL